MSSRDYWEKREKEALQRRITDEKEYDKQIMRIYRDMLTATQKEIEAFYGRYAKKEGITLAEAKKKVSKLDIKAYERKAKQYVEAAKRDRKTKGRTDPNADYFSDQANKEMRLYNATMRINRLEMLKANIGLEMIKGHAELETLMEAILQDRTMDELARQAGILGKTVRNNAQKAHAIVNASFHNATYLERIRMHRDLLEREIEKQLESGLIQGKNARELTKTLQSKFDVKIRDAERLMRTELARVQTEAQKQSFERNGFERYEFIVNGGCCPICALLDGKHPKVKDMMPGKNAPPMHPNCRCSIAAYEDSEEYEAWLDYLDKGGTTEEWNKIKNKYSSKSIVKSKDSGIMKQRRFNTKNDPMREVFGAAEVSNPEELQLIIDDLNKSGVEITRREKAMGYSPALRVGYPGQFIIEKGASYSAWCHEYKHFCDDRDDGYLGFRVFQDNEKCKRREIDAYQIEIDFAHKAGRDDIAEKLIKLRDEEVTKYE